MGQGGVSRLVAGAVFKTDERQDLSRVPTPCSRTQPSRMRSDRWVERW